MFEFRLFFIFLIDIELQYDGSRSSCWNLLPDRPFAYLPADIPASQVSASQAQSTRKSSELQGQLKHAACTGKLKHMPWLALVVNLRYLILYSSLRTYTSNALDLGTGSQKSSTQIPFLRDASPNPWVAVVYFSVTHVYANARAAEVSTISLPPKRFPASAP